MIPPIVKRAYDRTRLCKRILQGHSLDQQRRLQIETCLAVILSIAFALLLTALGA